MCAEPPTQNGLFFGRFVEISGNRVIVGAPGFDAGGGLDNIGKAYLYQRGTSGWSEIRILKSSEAAIGDGAGSTLALRGTVAVLGVLADEESPELAQQGSVVFFADLPDPCEE
ncbi:MAG TPA: hypothetical protein PKC90_06350 [Phycisphaerales bacterium]|nr:hypothetical protein [Phycisphaerales bacterium]